MDSFSLHWCKNSQPKKERVRDFSERSTEMAILDFIENILKKGTIQLNFIDQIINKVFESLNHNVFLSKLWQHGIRGIAYTWL